MFYPLKIFFLHVNFTLLKLISQAKTSFFIPWSSCQQETSNDVLCPCPFRKLKPSARHFQHTLLLLADKTLSRHKATSFCHKSKLKNPFFKGLFSLLFNRDSFVLSLKFCYDRGFCWRSSSPHGQKPPQPYLFSLHTFLT